MPRTVQYVQLCLRIKFNNLMCGKITGTIICINFSKNSIKTIEGFGGKRALGFLLKSELCQKRSKFRMQFCFRVSNNVLHVFSLKFASFLRYYVCKKHIFPRASSGDLLLNGKQKKPFVSLSDQLTIIP